MERHEETLNWQQACKIMGCSKSHFYNLVNSGALQSKRSGRVKGVSVSRADCEKWAKEWRERMGEEDAGFDGS